MASPQNRVEGERESVKPDLTQNVIDFMRERAEDGEDVDLDANSALLVLGRLAALQEEVTKAHALRWALGLETHEGEEPQSREDSHRNLAALLDRAVTNEESQDG